jgi:hypothetical protein
MCKKVYCDILPQFGVTSCPGARDILPLWGGDILPRRTRHPASFPSICPIVSWPTRSPKEASTDD